MTRDALTRMDVDTGWAYHHKVRKLQMLYPQDWPIYWAAYMALLGEAWKAGRAGRRRTLLEAWVPALPCTPEEALTALVTAGVTDKNGRIPASSWAEWVEPVVALLEAKRAGGQLGAERRWGQKTPPKGSGQSTPNGRPNAPSSPPASPPARGARAHTREDEGLVDAAEIMRRHGAGWVLGEHEEKVQ